MPFKNFLFALLFICGLFFLNACHTHNAESISETETESAAAAASSESLYETTAADSDMGFDLSSLPEHAAVLYRIHAEMTRFDLLICENPDAPHGIAYYLEDQTETGYDPVSIEMPDDIVYDKLIAIPIADGNRGGVIQTYIAFVNDGEIRYGEFRILTFGVELKPENQRQYVLQFVRMLPDDDPMRNYVTDAAVVYERALPDDVTVVYRVHASRTLYNLLICENPDAPHGIAYYLEGCRVSGYKALSIEIPDDIAYDELLLTPTGDGNSSSVINTYIGFVKNGEVRYGEFGTAIVGIDSSSDQYVLKFIRILPSDDPLIVQGYIENAFERYHAEND
ncbi:MAG: hypothetical protein ACI3XM_06355 [Eubacteriales bacterium]